MVPHFTEGPQANAKGKLLKDSGQEVVPEPIVWEGAVCDTETNSKTASHEIRDATEHRSQQKQRWANIGPFLPGHTLSPS